MGLATALRTLRARSPAYARRPLASDVLRRHLEAQSFPPWTSYFVRYRSVQDDDVGRSHFNFPVSSGNYHVLRTGCFPFIKYHATRRAPQDLSLDDRFFTALKVFNLGLPCLAYGLAATILIRHTEIVQTELGPVPIYFLYKEHMGGIVMALSPFEYSPTPYLIALILFVLFPLIYVMGVGVTKVLRTLGKTLSAVLSIFWGRMLAGSGPLVQAGLGSLFTWGLTALGAAGVFVLESQSALVLDTSLGFAAGVMTAASFWSLLAPALELAEAERGKAWSWAPVAVGLVLGAAFVHAADRLLPAVEDPGALSPPSSPERNNNSPEDTPPGLRRRRKGKDAEEPKDAPMSSRLSWRRVLLLIIAITVHNIPEGLAVGVGFGAIGSSPKATFESAVALTLGIGIQNFPEGLAVSLPLRGLGWSKMSAFIYGQASGMVEPVAALAGAALVGVMAALLPYALAFAAGAMIYVVVDDIVPEAASHGNGKAASWATIAGFTLMMALDVGLG